MIVVWAVISKTLEAADRARPVPVPEASKSVVKPSHRVLVVPSSKHAPEPATPSSTTNRKPKKDPPVPPPLPQPTPARAVIKLKVGSQAKTPESSSQPPTKSRKLKAAESPSSLLLEAPSGPPPPYVDDGSHDILQEVLAIEREKELRKERLVANTTTGKRKKDSSVDEDEILRLATPAKKERATTPGVFVTKPQGSSIPSSRLSLKVKREKPSESSRASKAYSPVPSAKGKEKESAAPYNAQANNARKTAPGMAGNEKKCKDLIKTLIKVPESLIFRRPVDPIRDGCPTYVLKNFI